MGIFSKKKEETTDCTCGGECTQEKVVQTDVDKVLFNVKVLGSGCAKCNALEKSAREALSELGIDTVIDHVTDYAEIAAYGVMSTPALVVNGKVVSYGKVLNKGDIIKILRAVK